MDIETLKQIGLNESEIKVYFALLELESSTVGPIIDKASVPDSKIYSILDKLKDKGLASYVIKNKIKHFQASDPKQLLRILDEKKKNIEEQKKELVEKIIPEIEQKRKITQEKQEAIVYESMKGLETAFAYMRDILEKGEEYQVFIFGKGLGTKQVVTFFREHHKKRINRGIKVRLIGDKKDKKIIEKSHRFIIQHTRYTTQKFPVGLYIFKNHVMTILWEEKSAFLIKSKSNYDSYKAFFEEIWKSSKP